MYPVFKWTPIAASILIALAGPVYSPQVLSVQGDRAAEEFLVNTYFDNKQSSPRIAMDADGDFVIAWESYLQDGSDPSIYAQRYNADGTTAGNEFKVNTETNNTQRFPSVAMDADGDFVIAWQSSLQDGSDFGVYAQRYNADGTTAGFEFKVNTHTTSKQISPVIAMDADGDFVIAWESESQDGSDDGVYAQRYNADGTIAGAEFSVNTYTANNQSFPSIAMDADGDFVIAWESNLQDGSKQGVYAQRYNADGTTAGDEFQVNTETTGGQLSPGIAVDADGDFVIVWVSENQDGSNKGVYAQRYNADGTTAGSEFKVNIHTAKAQTSPSIAMDADGDFVITWESKGQDVKGDPDGYGIYAQRYKADGSKAGATDNDILVNTKTDNQQESSSIAMDADGDFVIAWQSFGQDDSAPTSFGVYAQRYEGAGNSVDLNLVVQDNVDILAYGGSFFYSLFTTNNGTEAAMDVNLLVPIPTGLTYVSDDSALVGWGCALTGATLNCSKSFMTVGETNTIHVKVTADVGTRGTRSNTVTVNAAQTDSNAADNTDTETIFVSRRKEFFGIGSFSLTPLLLMLPLWLRRRWLN